MKIRPHSYHCPGPPPVKQFEVSEIRPPFAAMHSLSQTWVERAFPVSGWGTGNLTHAPRGMGRGTGNRSVGYKTYNWANRAKNVWINENRNNINGMNIIYLIKSIHQQIINQQNV